MAKLLLLFSTLVILSFTGRASHVMGGDITWTCSGGSYVFQLVFYRDCEGPDINTISETIEVWNHATITSITANYVSREDLSPICTQVGGGPLPLTCGAGAGGGSGIGAIEKIVYVSDPINLTGTPPVDGWIFTYDNFSRSANITNIPSPSTYGLTIVSKMFAIPGSPGGCVDNSPQFLQDPYFVSCVGDPYEYNMNAVDPDLDSLAISFGTPLNDFSGPFDPPTNPALIPYEATFSSVSPTPGPTLNPLNIPAQIHPSSGNLTFQSYNAGNFVVKIVAQSYRNGVLIAEIEREMQLIVQVCSGTNTAPNITGPFGGLFETTINAGDLVNFNLNSTDIELLQDGSAQNNILTATGLMFGTNYTNNTGCAIAPCATLNATPPITMSQGTSATFDWQTSCDHVVNPYGHAVEMIPYHFVFKVQDDYCPIPKVNYATITINVVNPGVIEAPSINCIQSDASNDVTITWTPVADPLGSFVEYQIYSIQNGLVGTETNIGTTSFTEIGAGTQINDYYISVVSGCGGNTMRNSDTLSNIYLDVVNPSNGTAVLQWNDPASPALSSMNAYYHIYREYPATVWSLYDSVPFGTNNYIDTVDICSTDLFYQIVLPNTPCDYTSNIDGDSFIDMMTPAIPILSEVSIDTMTNQVIINWDENVHEDTYGYVIYTLDQNGIPIEIDTVWGISNTTYSHNTNVDNGPLSYTVAAFDSCWTVALPPTYQTSAKGTIHTTTFAWSSLDICARTVDISWTDYVGWDDILEYRIYGYKGGDSWSLFGTSASATFSVDVDQFETYCFVVEAVHASGSTSFSNTTCIYISAPTEPQFNYLQVATVQNEEVHLRHLIDNSLSVAEISFQKENDAGVFEELIRIPVSGPNLSYIDSNVSVNEQSYTYRAQLIDSCGRLGSISNFAQTILVNAQIDDVSRLNYVYWSPYTEFDGSILGYNIYRGVNGFFGGAPIATVPNGQYSYEDDVYNVLTNGKICYRIEAIEAINSFSISERSFSNDACEIITPTIYIPNSFTPDGDELNDVFMPILSDFDPVDFDFVIFNRWGHPIFKTNQPNEGWDGIVTQNGKLAQSGTYLYVLSLRDGAGNEVLRKGHVNLLK